MSRWSLIELPDQIFVLQNLLVILTLLRYAIIERNYLRGRFPRRDLDQIVHVEATLEHGKLVIVLLELRIFLRLRFKAIFICDSLGFLDVNVLLDDDHSVWSDQDLRWYLQAK